MKNSLISKFMLLIYVLSSMFCVAQIPQPDENRVNNEINKFIGTWKWESGNSIFQIILKKENLKNQYLSFDYREDMLIGFHKYMDNGNIIENSTQFSNTNYLDKKSTIYGSTENNNPNKFVGSIRHKSKNKTINFKIEYIDSTHIRLEQLENRAGMKINLPGQPSYDWSISLPQNIILTKQ